jgi:maltose O-acetyltransferase
MKLIRFVCLVLYYCFARVLPSSSTKFTKWAGVIRALSCHGIFKFCGKNVNIEKGSYFGGGSQIEIGDNSGIGANCQTCGPI